MVHVINDVHDVHDVQDVRRTYYDNGNIKSEYYYTNNKLHRVDGPAIIIYRTDGTIERERYYVNNQQHRTDGPAGTYYNKDGTIKCEHYYYMDQKHRTNAPAIIRYHDGNIEHEYYYKHNIDITKALQKAHYHEADTNTKELIWSML